MSRAERVKLYFLILQHLKGALDAFWRLHFQKQPPKQYDILLHLKGALDAFWRLYFGEQPPQQHER